MGLKKIWSNSSFSSFDVFVISVCGEMGRGEYQSRLVFLEYKCLTVKNVTLHCVLVR